MAKPAILAVAINKIPTVVVTVREGARAVDPRLLEVARAEQRGQPSGWLCEWQLVRFSDIVIVNTPPSRGTSRNSQAEPALSRSCTAGREVQSAPLRPRRSVKA